jgi:steroid 5-alpha reductase family enzyme
MSQGEASHQTLFLLLLTSPLWGGFLAGLATFGPCALFGGAVFIVGISVEFTKALQEEDS